MDKKYIIIHLFSEKVDNPTLKNHEYSLVCKIAHMTNKTKTYNYAYMSKKKSTTQPDMIKEG